jgi:hypothetical protein
MRDLTGQRLGSPVRWAEAGAEPVGAFVYSARQLSRRPTRNWGSMSEEKRDVHAVRVARNQTLFRKVNEQVREVNEPFSDLVAAPEWVCECADPTCIEKVSLTMEEYEALRSDATHFAVAPNPSHVFLEVENVVGQTERYWIVEKTGIAGAVASTDSREELNPTSPEERELEQAVD